MLFYSPSIYPFVIILIVLILVVAGGNKSSSSLTLILVLIIVLLVIIIIIVLAYRCRQKIAAKISGRKHGTLVETKHGLNGNNDQLAVKFTANPNYDTPERDDVEHMYAEVKEGPGKTSFCIDNGSLLCPLARKLGGGAEL